MAKSTITVGVVIDEKTRVSFVDICENYNISEKELLDILEHGLISSIDSPNKKLQFDMDMLQRIKAAYRLQEDLGVNSAGAVLALELMDELDKLNSELDILKRHLEQL